MDTVVWAALAVAGLVAGIGIGFWLGRLQNDGERVTELETELETYRAQVTEHFAQSATHFQAIGRQYRDLYEHMAAGSEALCAADAKATMSFPAPGEVSALAESAAPVEPPMQPAAAATDVEEPEVIESMPYKTDALADDAEAAEAKSAESEVDVADDDAVKAAAAAVDDAVEEAVEAASGEVDEKADETAVPADAVADSEPEKRLYH